MECDGAAEGVIAMDGDVGGLGTHPLGLSCWIPAQHPPSWVTGARGSQAGELNAKSLLQTGLHGGKSNSQH